ncbi:hypothetical protein K505DRAFT_145334 [Melanomma pulvis-pyrius CBS 109.77]|uniref:Uncharacterized protein n=1 Tax=Melanomma pulvis-pyrius CBS 109.77 TaxID=1314802 RepID=A0A6A6WRA2_9PLEO|nr:hypothetical protein K505DRAFT_145334 [Melanomma pulvis-pyrius CBS 109.77]
MLPLRLLGLTAPPNQRAPWAWHIIRGEAWAAWRRGSMAAWPHGRMAASDSRNGSGQPKRAVNVDRPRTIRACARTSTPGFGRRRCAYPRVFDAPLPYIDIVMPRRQVITSASASRSLLLAAHFVSSASPAAPRLADAICCPSHCRSTQITVQCPCQRRSAASNSAALSWASPPPRVPPETTRPWLCPRCRLHALQLQRGPVALLIFQSSSRQQGTMPHPRRTAVPVS